MGICGSKPYYAPRSRGMGKRIQRCMFKLSEIGTQTDYYKPSASKHSSVHSSSSINSNSLSSFSCYLDDVVDKATQTTAKTEEEEEGESDLELEIMENPEVIKSANLVAKILKDDKRMAMEYALHGPGDYEPKIPYTSNPYGLPTKTHVRFHRNMADYVVGEAFRCFNKVPIEKQQFARGPKRLPDFMTPYVGLNLKCYLRQTDKVKDVHCASVFNEYAYLVDNVKYLILLIDVDSQDPSKVKVYMAENHRKKRTAKRNSKAFRYMDATHMWFIHGSEASAMLKGPEFDMVLAPGKSQDGRDAIGCCYKRRLDSLQAAKDIAVTWNAEVKVVLDEAGGEVDMWPPPSPQPQMPAVTLHPPPPPVVLPLAAYGPFLPGPGGAGGPYLPGDHGAGVLMHMAQQVPLPPDQ